MMMLMLIVAVLLQCFDQYSTLVLIQHGGIEANPLACWLFGFSDAGSVVIALKYLGAAVVCFIAWICGDERGAKVLGVIDGCLVPSPTTR